MVKKQCMLLSLLFVLLGCNLANPNQETIAEIDVSDTSDWSAEYEYLTFEEAVLEFATHIVVAQYVESRPFGDEHTEFEFVVVDEILGETTERIFIFVTHMDAHVYGHHYEVAFMPGDLSFETGVNYLLPLINSDSVHSVVYRDGDQFAFVMQIAINLDDPSESVMYSEPLDDHIENLTLDEETAVYEILDFVEDLAEEIEEIGRFEPIIIDSSDMREIIEGSPYVWVVEIGEAIRLSHEQAITTWVSNDLYYVYVSRVLKGSELSEGERMIVFTPDSVFPGETHIVAVAHIPESSFHDLTSRYGLFSIDQLEEINAIISEDLQAY